MSNAVVSLLMLGAGIGFVSGVSPGPVLTMVVSETLRGGWPRGAAVAAGPLLADGPILLLALLVLAQLPTELVRAVSVAGGVFLLYRAARALLASRQARSQAGRLLGPSGGLLQGLLARGLSPHPYIFWSLVGAPLLVEAGRQDWPGPLAFLLGYYSAIVGSNVALALAIHRCAGLLSAAVERSLLLLTAVILAGYGLVLLK